MSVYIYVYMCIYIYVCLPYIYICIYVYDGYGCMDEINKLNGCGSKPQTRLGTLNSWLMDVLFTPPYSYSPKIW